MIVTYICQVYVSMWFTIKCRSKFSRGPGHLFQLMQLVKEQPAQVQEVVKPHIQHNAYFAEPSIMLTSMLEDPEEDVRQFGVSLLKKARQNPPKVPKSKYLKGIRKHEIPVLNWNASNWKDMIDWKEIRVWEPRILKALSMEQIEAAVQSPICFPKYLVIPKQLKEWSSWLQRYPRLYMEIRSSKIRLFQSRQAESRGRRMIQRKTTKLTNIVID